MSEQAIVALVFIVGGFLVMILMIYFGFRAETGTYQTEASTSSEGGQTLEQRAGSLTIALSDSAHVIQEIETEIEPDVRWPRRCRTISKFTSVSRT
jgi:hypothetical protein